MGDDVAPLYAAATGITIAFAARYQLAAAAFFADSVSPEPPRTRCFHA